MVERTFNFAGAGAAPVLGANARAADNAALAEPPRARVVERSPALLRRANELMRDARWGRAGVDRIPFFCECRRDECFEPVWLTNEMYDARLAESGQPLVLPGHELAGAEGRWQQTA
jgi:hypothetical protein